MRTVLRKRLAGVLATVGAASGVALAVPAPAHAAWASTVNLSIQLTYRPPGGGSAVQVGRADGWVQFDDGGQSFRYSFNICRQSSFTIPALQVAVDGYYAGSTWYDTPLEYIYANYGTSTTPTSPCYGDTWTVTGQDTYTNPFNVEFILWGSNYGPYVQVSKNYVVPDPY